MDTYPRARSSRRPRRRTVTALLVAAASTLALPLVTAAPASSSAVGHRATPVRHAGEVALPEGLRPEGITSGPGSRYYVGSLADGRIVTGDLRTGSSTTLLAGEAGRQLRGLDHDRRTGLVWAAGNVGTASYVWAVDGRTGKVVQRTEVPGAAFLNDLVVTRRAVWVTDSGVDRLTVLPLGRHGRPTGAAPSFVALKGAWPTGNGSINANGIRQLPDGSAILNNTRVGGLWRADPSTGVVTRVPVSGGPGIVSGDGLELSGRTLYDVRGSGPAEVSVVTLSTHHGQWVARWVKALADPRLSVPSTATLVGDTLWAVNARFGVVPDPDTAPYWITPLRAR